ncbi:hypothetical protein [Paenarthrobacter sp. YJN-5]|uniref:hypothetical protein n=1 Tax=Paenarthrobacter sp. YJN-5 TaxID=2735316 RepID=UPI0018785424|nr:hypothetical protein [Paenarthrobacter sp. YJN-5]QOT19398.1 hypothetical protein HMI59_22355 [Paenarthrobacter sp. YJN-5]
MITKFRTYRNQIAADGVKPLTFTEWLLGRIAGRLEVRAATMASKRGDHQSLNHALLALWAGNQRGHAHLAASLPPAELNLAIKEDRLRLVVEAGG